MARRVTAAGLVLLILVACGGPPTPVDVALDPDGRPYDAPASWWENSHTETRSVGRFQIAEGELRVADGNLVGCRPWDLRGAELFGHEVQNVSFGAIDLVDLSVVWEIVVTEEGNEYEAPLGIRLDVAGRQVEQWESFEYAYGTGGGVGGVSSAFFFDGELGSVDDESCLIEPDFDKQVELFDFDGDGVNETVRFSNGFGDGGFPMTRGISADGELASLMIWHARYPWRLAVTDGSPPPDVTQREEEMSECIERRRDVDEYGFCQSDLEG